jgi:hypothetical protein
LRHSPIKISPFIGRQFHPHISWKITGGQSQTYNGDEDKNTFHGFPLLEIEFRRYYGAIRCQDENRIKSNKNSDNRAKGRDDIRLFPFIDEQIEHPGDDISPHHKSDCWNHLTLPFF